MATIRQQSLDEVRTTQLTKDFYTSEDIRELLNKLYSLRNKWFDIGIQLGVESEKLEEIRGRYPEHQDGLREMLIHRLKQDIPYEELQVALKSPTVNPGGKRLNEIFFNETEADKDMKPFCNMQKLPTFANKEEVDHTFKIIIVGDAGVGKTSLLQRFARASSEATLPTFTLGELSRVIQVDTGQRIKLVMWDTAGSESLFVGMPELYFRNADAVLIVFDVTSRKSFDHAVRERNDGRIEFKTWLKEVRYRCADIDPPLISLVGNKNDIKEREVNYDEANKFATMSNFDYVETSSLEDNNVDQLFFLVCQRLLEGKQGTATSPKAIVVATDVFRIATKDQNSAESSASSSRSRKKRCC